MSTDRNDAEGDAGRGGNEWRFDLSARAREAKKRREQWRFRREDEDRSSREHPENDLRSDADQTNLLPPEPRSVDELADQPDPGQIASEGERSTRQAIRLLIAVPIASVLASLLIAVAGRIAGGPYCEAGAATWLCSRGWELAWSIGSCVLPALGVAACAWMMLRKLRRFVRWRPWMGVFWVLLPHAMFWVFFAAPVGITGNPAV